jgi:hypothetical protein
MAHTTRRGTVAKKIKRGPGKRMVDGKSFRLADEVHYIQRRAAERDSRIVSIGQLVLFSSESGDAWMLDPSEHLAVRLASDGRPEPISIEDGETSFVVAWTGQYRIEGPAFLYADRDGKRAYTVFGYPTQALAQMAATSGGHNTLQLLTRARAKISNMFG